MSIQSKQLRKYIIPSMISNAAFFILTIVDGMFVGNGVGIDALGAVSLAMPYVMLIGAISVLFTIGGVAVAAIRLGRGDDEGANQAFMHSVTGIICVFVVLTFVGNSSCRSSGKCIGSKCDLSRYGFRLRFLVFPVFDSGRTFYMSCQFLP